MQDDHVRLAIPRRRVPMLLVDPADIGIEPELVGQRSPQGVVDPFLCV